ncbi:MAG: transcriptional regulator, partial [Pseudomonadota bacterium]
RLALGDDGRTQRLIKTHHRQGFRFIADVETKSSVKAVPVDSTPTGTDAEYEASQAPEPSKPSIAILPFRLVGIAGPNAAIADALPYELISELSRMPWLHVTARGSSFRFREVDPDIVSIGQVLRVRYCLTGIIEIIGNNICVMVEVAETENAHIIWNERFKSTIDDIQEIREQITSHITAALEIHIPMREARLAKLKPVENLDAWALYHLGLRHLYCFTKEDNAKAADMFERAIALQPDFSRAYAGLSSTEYYSARTHYTNDYAASAKACRDYADKSLDLEPLDPYANYAMGRAFTVMGDNDQAMSWYDRTLSVRPNYAQCLYSVALTDTLAEQGEKGQQRIDNALALSPLDPFLCAMYSVRTFSHIIREEYSEAVLWAEKVMSTPNVHPHYSSIPAIAHTLNGNMERGLNWYKKLKENFPDSSYHDFFVSFPFQDGAVRERIMNALLVHETATR